MHCHRNPQYAGAIADGAAAFGGAAAKAATRGRGGAFAEQIGRAGGRAIGEVLESVLNTEKPAQPPSPSPLTDEKIGHAIHDSKLDPNHEDNLGLTPEKSNFNPDLKEALDTFNGNKRELAERIAREAQNQINSGKANISNVIDSDGPKNIAKGIIDIGKARIGYRGQVAPSGSFSLGSSYNAAKPF